MYVCKEKRPASCIVRYDTYVVRLDLVVMTPSMMNQLLLKLK